MSIKHIFYFVFICSVFYFTGTTITGCAQIGTPTGGPKDTLPPVLIKAMPAERTVNFKGDKIELTFDEYIDIQDIQKNVLVSPYPKTNPNITFKLKTVTIKLKDTLLDNTTYSINFGNSLKDLNEGNPFRYYTYVFSTGNSIDSLQLHGNVILAESGQVDSTIVAMLYKNVPDSTVEHRKPDYIANVDGKGDFTFNNLAAGTYKVYALGDGDGGKTYNSPVETFAFADSDIIVSANTKPVTLYAYAEEKDEKAATPAATTTKTTADKKLKFTPGATPANPQSLLTPMTLTFSRPVIIADEKKIVLMDTTYQKAISSKISLDSTKKIMTLSAQWAEGFDYSLIIGKDAVTDTLGNPLSKTDTVRFKSKSAADYGNLVLRFTKYDAAKHLVLQFLKGDELIRSVPVTSNKWNDPLFEPGEYDLRILNDENNNGKWDPGSYKEKRQPEKAIAIPKKLSVRANWDNEKDVEL